MPLILITNDDGVFSPGLQAAAEAVADLGDLLIAAPRYQQTGMSRSLPGGKDVGIIEETTLTINGTVHPAYGIHAAPALAGVYAMLEIAPWRPDLCISGINYGENIGRTISASGTVGAALEASTCGVPGVAISREAPLHLHRAQEYESLDWTTAKHFTRLVVERVLTHGMPPQVEVLNVNIPDKATRHTAIRTTVQSRQAHVYYTKPEQQDWSKSFILPFTNTVDRDTLEPDSDIQALLYDGVVSISPLTGHLAAPIDPGDFAVRFDFGHVTDPKKPQGET